MAEFDPFASGQATLAAPPPGAEKEFDPFKNGAATPTAGAPVPSYLLRTADPEAHWKNAFSGLDGVDQRMEPEQRAGFAALDRVSENPKAARAAAITQAFVAERTNIPGPYLARNWEASKLAYAKTSLGLNVESISDEALYTAIAKRHGAEKTASPEAEKKPWTYNEPFMRAAAANVISPAYGAYRNLQRVREVGFGKAMSEYWETINRPLVDLPEPPANLPDIGGAGTPGGITPAVTAGVYRGAIKPILESVETPLGIATLGVGTELAAAAKSYQLAKAAFTGMTGVFTALMGYNFVNALPERRKVLNDPNASTEDRSAALSGAVGDGAMALIGAFGTIHSVMPERAPPILKSLEGKPPSKAAEVLRTEAVTATPEGADALNQAAAKLDELAPFEKGPTPETVTGPERIKAAAVKTADGNIVEGPTHEAAKRDVARVEQDQAIVQDFLNKHPSLEGAKEGFVTTEGRFVSREEAAVLAADTGQLKTAETPKALQAHEVEMAEPPIRSAFGQTALKNAYDTLERVAYGFPDAPESEQRAMTERWARAEEVLAKDPEAGARLSAQLKVNPNLGLTDDQSALLLRHKVGLSNALNEAADALADPNSSPQLKAEAEAQVADLSKSLLELNDAVRRRGSEWGREGRWRQAIAQEDFSFATQQTLLRAAKGGAELTEGERIGLQKRIDELEKKQAELEAREAQTMSVSHTEAADRAVRALTKPPRAPRQFRGAEAVRQKLHDKAAESRKFLAGKLLSPTPEDLYHMAVIGADQIFSTGLDFAKWSTAMVSELGEKVRPALAGVWDAARKLFYVAKRDAIIERLTGKVSLEQLSDEALLSLSQKPGSNEKGVVSGLQRSVVEGVRENASPDEGSKIQVELQGIRSRIFETGKTDPKELRDMWESEIGNASPELQGAVKRYMALQGVPSGPPPTEAQLSTAAQELARDHLEQGVKGRDAVVEAVQRDLEQAVPGISKREVMDAISGYGKFKPLTHDQITDQLRDIKGQLQQVAKLEDMAAGQAPKKTGMERKVQSDEERRLVQEVEAKKKAGGYAVTDPERQLRTALQAVRKNIENRIKDLAREMETGEPKPKGKAPTDAAIEALKELRDRVKESVAAVAKKSERTPEERIAAALESTNAAIDRLEENLNDGKIWPEGKKDEPWSPDLGVRKRYLNELQGFRKELQKFERPPKTAQEQALAAVKSRLAKDIKDLERQITTRTADVKEKKGVVYDDEAARLKLRRDELREEYEGVFGRKELTEEQRLNIWKAYANRQIARLNERLAAKDFEPKAKRPPPAMDAEGNRIRGELEAIKQDFAIERAAAAEAKKPAWQKGMNEIAGFSRAMAISGYHTLAKLATFSLGRFAEAPVVEALGALIRGVPGIEEIAKQANLEAGREYEALAKFYTKAATDGMTAAWETIQRGKSTLKAELGDRKSNEAVTHWYDWIGVSHMAEKSPLLVGDFNLRLEKGYQHAIANGIDVNNPMVAAALRKDAYTYAQRAILQEKNMFSDWINSLSTRLEAENPKTGKSDIIKVSLATFIKTFLTKGIVKTPSNYIMQTLERTPLGLAKGTAQAFVAHMNGVDKLTPEEANVIFRLLKVGAIGSAMFVWGMIDATKDPKDRIFGGYYQPGEKRGDEDVSWGKIRVDGVSFPHFMTHNPMTESAQMGTTFVRVMKSRLTKKDAGERGPLAGAVASIMALASEAPVANPITRNAQAIERGEGQKILWDWAASNVPMFVQNIAQDLDGKARRPESFKQAMELTIPGLRGNVPETKAQKKRDIKERLKKK